MDGEVYAKRVALSGRLRLGWYIRGAGDQSGLDSEQLRPYRQEKPSDSLASSERGELLAGSLEVFCPTLLSRSLGAEGLFLVMGGSIAISTGLVFAISRNERITPALRNAPAIKSQRSATLRESFSLVISSPHLLAIASLVCICSIATYIAGWQFRAIVKETLPDKDAMAAFLGTFYGATGVLAMLIQVLLTPRLLRHFGIGVALFILPLTLIAGTTAIIVSGAMWAATLLRGSDKVVRYSIDNAALQMLFLPASPENKVQARSFLDTVVPRGADGLGAVSVLLLTAGAGFGAAQLGWIVLALLVALDSRRTSGGQTVHCHARRLASSAQA